MRNFPWLEAALIVALAVALIVKPQKQADAQTTPLPSDAYAVLGR